jgi:hypothetical protein
VSEGGRRRGRRSRLLRGFLLRHGLLCGGRAEPVDAPHDARCVHGWGCPLALYSVPFLRPLLSSVPRVLAADMVSYVLTTYAAPPSLPPIPSAAAAVSDALRPGTHDSGAAPNSAATTAAAGADTLRAMLLRSTSALLVPLLLRQLPTQASFPLLLRCFRMARDAVTQLALAVSAPLLHSQGPALAGSSSVGGGHSATGLRALVSLLVRGQCYKNGKVCLRLTLPLPPAAAHNRCASCTRREATAARTWALMRHARWTASGLRGRASSRGRTGRCSCRRHSHSSRPPPQLHHLRWLLGQGQPQEPAASVTPHPTRWLVPPPHPPPRSHRLQRPPLPRAPRLLLRQKRRRRRR